MVATPPRTLKPKCLRVVSSPWENLASIFQPTCPSSDLELFLSSSHCVQTRESMVQSAEPTVAEARWGGQTGLPAGLGITGYDADTQTYQLVDEAGMPWETAPGCEGGDVYPSQKAKALPRVTISSTADILYYTPVNSGIWDRRRRGFGE